MTVTIRPELPGTERRPIEVGQVWTVDGQTGCRWFVIAPGRVIALFAGASDHTPASLVHVYGDRLRLEQIATVYADAVKQGDPLVAELLERNDELAAEVLRLNKELSGDDVNQEQHATTPEDATRKRDPYNFDAMYVVRAAFNRGGLTHVAATLDYDPQVRVAVCAGEDRAYGWETIANVCVAFTIARQPNGVKPGDVVKVQSNRMPEIVPRGAVAWAPGERND